VAQDCIEYLGGPRDMRYVAQENLEPLPLAHRRIKHPRLSLALFSGFDPAAGRWIPSDNLAYQVCARRGVRVRLRSRARVLARARRAVAGAARYDGLSCRRARAYCV
jgi:hypothetical protein